MRLSNVFVALFLLPALIPGSTVSGFRIMMPRQELMNMLAYRGEAAEERLYMDRCSHSNDDGKCYRALDGDVFKEWTQCTGTKAEFNPRWTGHLEAPAYVTRIVIHTVELPDPAMKNALASFRLIVDGMPCYSYKSSEPFESKSFPCDSLGDEVMVISDVPGSSVMALCEVEVYGIPVAFEGIEGPPSEISLASCTMSSTESPKEGCEKALDRVFVQQDGVSGKTCARSQEQDRPEISIELETPVLVTSIKLFNRIDAAVNDEMKHFEVYVSGKMCGSEYKGQTGFSTLVLSCLRFGNSIHVRSQLSKSRLNLCQIQVFGYKMRSTILSVYYPLGCFADHPEEPDLNEVVSGTMMTPDKCHQLCKRKNAPRFGLQNGRACLCGNKYGRHGKSDNCTMSCVMDEKFICGGFLANSMYEIEA